MKYRICPTCSGTGKVPVILKARSMGITDWSGYRPQNATCHTCNGKGRYEHHQEVTIEGSSTRE